MAYKLKRWANNIRYREHESRMCSGHLDRYFILHYKRNGITYDEPLGWESQNQVPGGKKLCDVAQEIMVMLRENWRTKKGPQTLEELREYNKRQRAEEERQAAEEQSRLITLNTFFEDKFKSYSIGRKQKSSYDKELYLYDKWIKPIAGDKAVVEINHETFQAIISTMRKKGLQISTIKYVIGTFRRILGYANVIIGDMRIPSMRELGVKTNINNRRTRVITREEENKILSALKPRDICAYRIVKFAFLTGCRFSEAAGLKWGDIIDEHGVQFRKTKNSEQRTIPFSQSLKEFFSSLVRARDSSLVFPNSEGNQYKESPEAFKNIIKALQLNEGRDRLDRISFHSIRHTVATRLAQHIHDVRNLMDIMGWKRVEMAARYIHGSTELQISALDKISDNGVDANKEEVIPVIKKKAVKHKREDAIRQIMNKLYLD